jgi:hypothetical protein
MLSNQIGQFVDIYGFHVNRFATAIKRKTCRDITQVFVGLADGGSLPLHSLLLEVALNLQLLLVVLLAVDALSQLVNIHLCQLVVIGNHQPCTKVVRKTFFAMALRTLFLGIVHGALTNLEP